MPQDYILLLSVSPSCFEPCCTSVQQGAISFVSIAERMKIQLGSRSIRYFREKDVFRINRAEKRQQAVEKKRMETMKWHKAAAQRQFSTSEGRTYHAGGF